MYTQPPPNPRGAVALGLAIVAAWFAAFGVALVTGDSTDERHAAPAPGAVELESR
jgi:hypothetical protein